MTTVQAGAALVRSADALLERSARSFTRAATVPAADDPGPGASPPPEDAATDDLVGAAVGLVTADLSHRSGTLLIRVQREQDRALLDVLA